MNAKANNSNATIAFTLPISCQICLEKVKQPVVCPNQHVFCSDCLSIWLERIQQCPACRVPITADNPCRQVLGGLNPRAEKSDHFITRELRRARIQLIYKDYENEIDRLEGELNASRQENKELREMLQKSRVESQPTSPSTPPMLEQDRSMISLLNRKIGDATSLYDQVKAQLSSFKKENTALKTQVADSAREKQSLRLELSSRSPRRFGRCTVAALEGKVEASERQVKQLQKALENSDSYIEEMQKELDTLRKGNSLSDTAITDKQYNSRGENDFDISNIDGPSEINASDLPSWKGNSSVAISDIVSEGTMNESDLFNRPLNVRPKPSFDLEESQQTAKDGHSVSYTDLQRSQTEYSSQKSRLSEPTPDTCKKKLRFAQEDDSSQQSTSSKIQDQNCKLSLVKPAPVQPKTNVVSMDSQAAPDMNASLLDVSMSSDLEDCMRIMDEAKRKLEKRQPQLSGSPRQVTKPQGTKQFLPGTQSQGTGHSGTYLQGLEPQQSLGAEHRVSHPLSSVRIKPVGVSQGVSSTLSPNQSNARCAHTEPITAKPVSVAQEFSMFSHTQTRNLIQGPSQPSESTADRTSQQNSQQDTFLSEASRSQIDSLIRGSSSHRAPVPFDSLSQNHSHRLNGSQQP